MRSGADQGAEALAAHAAAKHQDWALAWGELCDLATARYGEDPKAFARVLPALLKSLRRWPKLGQQAPARWLWDAARYGHLIALARNVTIYPDPLEEPWTADALASALSAPMPRVVTLTLNQLPLDRKAWLALCQNTSFTALDALSVLRCGLRNDWIEPLLLSDALWSSLTSLTLAESSLTGIAATALANSPRMASLKALALPECRIGEAGRRALGASPHLPDKVKRKNRFPLSASNVAAEQAPPAPREAFGDVRSLLQEAPSAHNWAKLCDLFDRLQHSPDKGRLQVELVPYTQQALARWPDDLLVAPSSWVQAACDGREPPAGLHLARALRFEGGLVRVDKMRALSRCGAIAQISHLAVHDADISGKALDHLLDSPMGASLRSLTLPDAASDTIGASLCKPRPDLRLDALSIRASHLLDSPAEPLNQTLAHLRHLTTHNDAYHSTPWRELLSSPWAAQLESLHLNGLLSPTAWQAIAAATALPRGLRALKLSSGAGIILNPLTEWLAQCPQLDALTCPIEVGRAASALGPALRDLHLTFDAYEADPADVRGWARAALPGLRRFTFSGDLHSVLTLPHALSESSWLGSLESLTLERVTLGAETLRGLLVRAPLLNSLALDGVQLPTLALLLADAPWPHLTSLRVERCGLKLDQLNTLAGASWWPQLKRLTFTNLSSYYDDQYTAHTPNPDKHPWCYKLPAGLEHLDLSAQYGAANLLPAIATSPAAKTIRHLKLTHNSIDEPAMLALVDGLAGLPALQTLDLSHNSYIKERAARALLASPATARLSELSLRRCYLGVRARSELLGAPHIMLSAKERMFTLEEQR